MRNEVFCACLFAGIRIEERLDETQSTMLTEGGREKERKRGREREER